MPPLRDLSQATAQAQTVEEFVYCRKKLKEVPAELLQFTQLKKLDLSYNLLATLPQSFQQLNTLRFLKLNNNHFHKLPAAILGLKDLQYLDLRFNRLHTISESIIQLTALESFNLRANYLHELPSELGQLPRLRNINLQQNIALDLAQIAEVLGQLKHPFELDLSACRLYTLPDNFGKMTYLSNLKLADNPQLDLQDTFAKLAQLPHLEALNIENTSNEIPENITQLQHLHTLTYNQLGRGVGARYLVKLKNLKYLDAKKSKLAYIPDWLMQMPQLQSLNLSDNHISYLPEDFKNLKNLKKLDFRNNSFTKIPPILSQHLAQFEELNLEGNRNIPSKKLNKFLRVCREQGLSAHQKELACQLWNGNIPKVPWSVELSLPLLRLNLPILSKNTLAWLEQNPIQQKATFLKPTQKVVLLGGSLRYSQREARQFLEKKGVEVYTQPPFPKEIDGWIVGERIKENLPIPARSPEVWWSDAYLSEKMPLPTLPSEQILKINALLTHPAAQNQQLGLQMLRPYDLPAQLREAVVVIYLFQKEKKLKQTAHAFVKKYFPNLLQAEMLKIEELEPEAGLKILMKHTFFDAKRLANTAYLVARIGEKYVVELGGFAFKTLIKEKINYRNILSLQLNITDISFELKEYKAIQKIEVIGSVYQKIEMMHIPEVLYEMPQLTYLRIDDANLSQIEDRISLFQNLTKLRLANSKISYLPESLGQLKKLEALSLFNNHLRTLPESIGTLSQLKELWLFSNQLQDIPESIGRLSALERLHLSANQLQTLPESIKHLKNLQELSLSGNPLVSLPEGIVELTQLKRLEIRRNTVLDKSYREWLQQHLPHCSIHFHY